MAEILKVEIITIRYSVSKQQLDGAVYILDISYKYLLTISYLITDNLLLIARHCNYFILVNCLISYMLKLCLVF